MLKTMAGKLTLKLAIVTPPPCRGQLSDPLGEVAEDVTCVQD